MWITAMRKAIKLPETEGIHLQEDFLVVYKDLDSEYATTYLYDVYRVKNSGITDQLPTLEDYMSKFTNFLHCNKPHSTGLSTNAAELEAANPANTLTTTGGTRAIPT